ncbi:uncharacterized protein [Watersipora subatra]|uniref:uncharacterized protein isoform X2 n=1 Tax=Watersipora subatra TaxID=2589382 RepID=UPI00355C006B
MSSISAILQGQLLDNEADKSEELITIVTDDDESVPSHDKTPLPQYRSNPAICIQEYMAGMDSSVCQGLLQKSISLSRRYSTEGYEHYTDSVDKVKKLLGNFSDMIIENMPHHAVEAMESEVEGTGNKPPEVLLVRGIITAGNSKYEAAIETYKCVLRACEGAAVRFRELRISTLNHIGICFCLMGNFAEAERYYQFAQDEYRKDPELLAHNISNYSEITDVSESDFKSNLPIEKYLQQLSMKQMENDDFTGGSSSSYDHGDSQLADMKEDYSIKNEATLSARETPLEVQLDEREKGWFPESKEELLDYSAAYIQLMIMGAEMVRRQQDAARASIRRI